MEYAPTFRLYEQDPPPPRRRAVQRILFLSLLALFLALQLPLLASHPPAMFDESALSRIATFIARGEGIRSDYIPAQEQGAFWLPPLYTILLAPWLAVAGSGIFSARLLSVLLGAAAILLAGALLREEKITGYRRLLVLAILAFDPPFFRAAALARPEMLASVLLLAALLILRRTRRSDGARGPLTAGIFSAAAVCAHPLFILPAPILLVLLWNRERRARAILLFLAPHAAAAALLLIWILPHWSLAYPQILRNIFFRKGMHWPDHFANAWESFASHYFTALLYLAALIDSLLMLARNRGRAPWYAFGMLLLPLWLFLFTGIQSLVVASIFLPFALFRLAFAVERKRTWHFAALWFMIIACAVTPVDRYLELPRPALRGNLSGNYGILAQQISRRLEPDSRVLVYGYPDVALGLWNLRPDLRLRTFYWFSMDESYRELRSVRYIVHARSGGAEAGEKLFRGFWNVVAERLVAIGRTMRDSTIVGNELSGGFSARIYELNDSEKESHESRH